MTEEQIKQKAEIQTKGWKEQNNCIQAYIAGYHECQKEHEEKCKTSYIKGIRTMANALKDYDRTDGAWTDYFEHTVNEVLERLLKESE